MAENAQSDTNWKAIKSWIVGITGVIVVIPALINSSVDLYNSVMNIPRTEAEENNINLFKKHMGKQPLVDIPLPVRMGAATYDASFSIYDGGDIYVKYGDTSQWFPFPESHEADASTFSLISTASAAEIETRVAAAYQQTESIDGDYLIRKKAYSDGEMEQQVIDMRSGKIIQTKKEVTTRTETPAEAEMAAPASPTPAESSKQVISPFAVIDLNAIKQASTPQATATTCKTMQGNCALLHAVTPGSECTCPSSTGELKGTAQ